MSDRRVVASFALTQVAWLLMITTATVAVGVFSQPKGFIVWFGGFLVILECTPPDCLDSKTSTALRLSVPVGYAVFAVATTLVVT